MEHKPCKYCDDTGYLQLTAKGVAELISCPCRYSNSELKEKVKKPKWSG